MVRPRHSTKEIEAAVKYAESKGWTVRISIKGHAWGRLLCPLNTREGCQVAVWSTPKHSQDHAKDIMRAVDRCPGCHGEKDEQI